MAEQMTNVFNPDDPAMRALEPLFATAEELHAALSAIDPNLVVTLTFGDRKRAPLAGGNIELANRGADFAAGTFRNQWSNDDGHFVNAFSKSGDGFANVSFLTEVEKAKE
jgi:hypothetical protein